MKKLQSETLQFRNFFEISHTFSKLHRIVHGKHRQIEYNYNKSGEEGQEDQKSRLQFGDGLLSREIVLIRIYYDAKKSLVSNKWNNNGDYGKASDSKASDNIEGVTGDQDSRDERFSI